MDRKPRGTLSSRDMIWFLQDVGRNQVYTAASLYERYQCWCEEVGRVPIGKAMFGRRLARVMCMPRRVWVDGNAHAGWEVPEELWDEYPGEWRSAPSTGHQA